MHNSLLMKRQSGVLYNGLNIFVLSACRKVALSDIMQDVIQIVQIYKVTHNGEHREVNLKQIIGHLTHLWFKVIILT